MKTSKLTRLVALTGLGAATLALLSAFVPTDTALGSDGNASGIANPAAVYCHELGYEYKIVDTDEGQYGICVFPDGSECDEWRFLAGECAEGYSYCARQGYDLITKTDGKNPFSMRYSVCVHDQQEIGPVTELMGLSEKATRGSFPVERTATPPEGGAPLGSPPSSFNWRNHNGQDWMTSVKNQGHCGSCWAFSALGVVEAIYNIAWDNANLDLDLSEEYLVSDCHTDPSYDQNCCGGRHNLALQFVKTDGIPDEGCMPYADAACECDGTCSSTKCTYHTGNKCSNRTCSDRCADWAGRLKRIQRTGSVASDQAAIKQNVLDRGPLAAGIYMSGAFDGAGIYRCTAPLTGYHFVVIAGYHDADGSEPGYWIAKNSWGSSWNGDGYFKVGYGECAIETDVYYAEIAPRAVGGIVEIPVGQPGSAARLAEGSAASPPPYAAMAGGAAAALALAAAGWYARRRWLR